MPELGFTAQCPPLPYFLAAVLNLRPLPQVVPSSAPPSTCQLSTPALALLLPFRPRGPGTALHPSAGGNASLLSGDLIQQSPLRRDTPRHLPGSAQARRSPGSLPGQRRPPPAPTAPWFTFAPELVTEPPVLGSGGLPVGNSVPSLAPCLAPIKHYHQYLLTWWLLNRQEGNTGADRNLKSRDSCGYFA